MVLLTPQEIAQLTGWAQKSKQIQWLQDNGVHHWVNAGGFPQVYERSLEGGKKTRRAEPNFEALRKAG